MPYPAPVCVTRSVTPVDCRKKSVGYFLLLHAHMHHSCVDLRMTPLLSFFFILSHFVLPVFLLSPSPPPPLSLSSFLLRLFLSSFFFYLSFFISSCLSLYVFLNFCLPPCPFLSFFLLFTALSVCLSFFLARTKNLFV